MTQVARSIGSDAATTSLFQPPGRGTRAGRAKFPNAAIGSWISSKPRPIQAFPPSHTVYGA
jgi:hypothetical protein